MARILIGNIKGPAGTMRVGTVTTGAAGSEAEVTNTGTESSAVLNFTIPQGATGKTGATGLTGPTGPMPPLINNLTTNQAGAGALDAAQGKVLSDAVDTLNRNISGWEKGTVTFKSGFSNTTGVLLINKSIKIGFLKIIYTTGASVKAGWTEVASLSCSAKENTLERIPLSGITKDFQINGSIASMYFEDSDANKRFFITKMFIIS